MAEEDPSRAARTPTDPSLEFDVFGTATLRLAKALMRHDRLTARRLIGARST